MAEAYLFQLAPRVGRERAHDLLYEAALISRDEHIDLREALVRVLGSDGAALPAIEPEAYLGLSTSDARDAVADWRRGRLPVG
jgi:3-carboxy-cis,cis-muconate cycloisomerase